MNPNHIIKMGKQPFPICISWTIFIVPASLASDFDKSENFLIVITGVIVFNIVSSRPGSHFKIEFSLI